MDALTFYVLFKRDDKGTAGLKLGGEIKWNSRPRMFTRAADAVRYADLWGAEVVGVHIPIDGPPEIISHRLIQA